MLAVVRSAPLARRRLARPTPRRDTPPPARPTPTRPRSPYSPLFADALFTMAPRVSLVYGASHRPVYWTAIPNAKWYSANGLWNGAAPVRARLATASQRCAP